jgi:ABC-type phosphate/phosphonate transport system substrate-binding protein
LATLKKKNGAQFAGVIVVRKNSGITKSENLRGKKVIALGKKAAGGYVFQAYHLSQKGINPETDFKQLRRAKKQDDMVLAVKAGVMDAAFIRSGILEAMHKEGKININDFAIVDERSGDGLALRHTTQLYPEFYLMKMPKTSNGKAEKVRQLSVNMKADSKAAQTAKIVGFVDPVDMSSMKQALKALKINPYN